jgi:hypothetical protein
MPKIVPAARMRTAVVDAIRATPYLEGGYSLAASR